MDIMLGENIIVKTAKDCYNENVDMRKSLEIYGVTVRMKIEKDEI